ncbi:D-3-phosphoglycerate dehydrogenase [Chaetoceros tenuissimus]|uniref:2-oxoglutarate reductase n=1 Tax=Chaetoceros tenuissimus TaxID=426638 RepID=A0AAD3D8T2_9STRA|nr:D-3-phosphoglycerate dehydrogenase [Chaetoceros tenuissimus]
MISLANSAARRSLRTVSQVRTLSSGIDIDVDHYSSGWNIDDIGEFTAKTGKYQIKTFNKISEKGLARFNPEKFEIMGSDWDSTNANAILLRSHKLQESEIDVSVRAIARCGAGTNNVPVARCSELGIPVFNTPGANANAVKELVLCGMLLGSRRIVDGVNHMKDLGAQGLAKERVEKDKSMFGGQEIKGKTLAVIGLGHIGASTARDAAALGMDIVGYDPGLSIDSALKLPNEIDLTDSIASAVANADYISINIPYIKGENGTHGIIGKNVISSFKPNAVLLNFARGELVDSEAMKEFLDNGDGRYVSDFPDDLLWDHKNAVILPHLGASTEEAEDAAAAMAADTISDYLQTGTIVNSVNFPAVSLPARPDGAIRMSVINKNQPGVLASITDVFAKAKLNIVQQINQSRGDVAYNVLDIDPTANHEAISMKDLQKELTMTDGVLSSRVVFGTPGCGYARNIDGQYWV